MHLNPLSKTIMLSLALGLGACQPSTPTIEASAETDASYIELGEKIVKTRCAVCHNAKATGPSPRADAPPLRTVLATYNSSALADDFRERIHVGHPDMPDFNFTVKEVDGLLAYLRSIQEENPVPQ